MELKDYVRVVRSYWRAVVAMVLLTVAASAGLSIMQPKVYQADASGFVSAGSSSNPGEASVGDALAKSRAASYVDLAKSRATASAVIDELGLTMAPASLIGSVSVSQPPDTVLIKISARAGSPRAAQRLADAWVQALERQVAQVENPGGTAGQALRVVPIESAALPSAPVSPNLVRNLGLGLVAGLLLGTAYAVVRSQLDRKLRRAEDIERQFGVTVAAAIPTSAAMVRKRGGLVPLVVGLADGRDPVHTAEAFLKLRTNLQFMDIDNPPRVIVVTSPMQGDGKSSVAANLAAALSMSDRRVVLIDGDLRRPVVAESFGLVEGAGLTDVLIGRVEFADVAQQVHGLPDLTVLAAGGTPPNPSELLGSKAMRRLLEGLADSGYTVIIDAPPLLPVTDAAVLTASADGALVVVTAGQTLDSHLAASLGSLHAVQGHTLGVVLNRVAPKGNDSGYYGGYYGPTAQTAPRRRATRREQATRRPAARPETPAEKAQVGRAA
ncbi:polysaccharide biosynthesis tyrosine autokinase [Pedococcus sp. 5OH_020]|uniref:polysaccharide biosynthesis tyrosine autokinase n=1 Tax=Pedococcus sp. 5OH_020 TaxID=2989814 RepID=UPI0022E9A579|nr:polysaccharide biosynthesis tyrosine autokinase [Pedococcus sp. 5OH_020]